MTIPFLIPKDSIRHVFLDIDGTIVNSKGVITPRVRQTIDALHKRKITVSLASGRPTFGAHQIMKDLSIASPCIFFSSAAIFDPVTNSFIRECALDPKELRVFLEDVKASGLYAELYTGTHYYIEKRTGITEIHKEYIKLDPIMCSFDEIIRTASILKCVVISDGECEEAQLRSLVERHPEYEYGIAVGAAHKGITYCNATNKSAGREDAFLFVTNHLGVRADQVMSIGDGESDMTFMRLSGAGVAMGNASELVRKAARYITSHVDEDGAAVALETLLFHHS